MEVGGARVVNCSGRTWLSLGRRLSLGGVGGTAGFPIALHLEEISLFLCPCLNDLRLWIWGSVLGALSDTFPLGPKT